MRAIPRRRLMAALLLLLVAATVRTLSAAPGGVLAADVVAPPSPVASAPAAVEQQSGPDPLILVRQAFDLLYGGFDRPLPSNVLLSDAWDGLNSVLTTAGSTAAASPAFSGDVDADWKAFVAAYRRVASNASIDPTLLAYGAINRMATARNSCHTAFLTPEISAAFNGSETHQPTVDVGFVAGRDDLVVYRLYPGGPAERAGLQPGDTILTSAGRGAPGILRRIFYAPADKPVDVTIQRPGVADPIALSIVPETTVLPFIRTQVLPGGIGVIQWDDFTAGAGMVAAIRQALTDFEAQGVVGWVLDLRTSPGGDSHTMAAIASLFLPSGRVVTQIDRAGGRSDIMVDSTATFPVQRPLVILTEKFSASAADILPGVLQDNGRAYVIGNTTDGCVSSSTVNALADGSALQIEVNRILVGNDDLDLDGVGVTPNETIIRTPEILAAGEDPQLDRAVAYLLSVAGR
jgi:carboxyl-terminal processing protease